MSPSRIEEGNSNGSNGPHCSALANMIMVRLQSQVIPLIVSGNNIRYKPNIDVEEVEFLVKQIIKDDNERKEVELSSILNIKRPPVSPNLLNHPELCATLKKYGICLQDCRLHESILRELMFLNEYHGNSKQQILIHYKGIGKGRVSLVRVP